MQNLIVGTYLILWSHEWTQEAKAATSNGLPVPFWDSRVTQISLLGALELAGYILDEDISEVARQMQYNIVTSNMEWFGGWLSAEPTRSLVSFNDKIASSKDEVLLLIEGLLQEPINFCI